MYENCNTMNAGLVVEIPRCGEDTQTLLYIKKAVGTQNSGHECSCHHLHPRHLVKLSLTIFTELLSVLTVIPVCNIYIFLEFEFQQLGQ